MDAVAQRLKAASEQLGRELAHEGGLPDGQWVIEIKAGVVTVRPRTVEEKPSPAPKVTLREV